MYIIHVKWLELSRTNMSIMSIKPASGISADGFEVQIEENEVISLKYI